MHIVAKPLASLDRRRLLLSIAVFAAAGVSTASAQSYDAVSAFTGSGPSGTWSYLGASTVGGTLSPLATPITLTSQYSGLCNGGSIPNDVLVLRNFGPGTITLNGNTTVVPTNLLVLDPQNDVVDVRWTAPVFGDYIISGLFQPVQTDIKPVEVQVLENLSSTGQTSLLSDPLANPTYGQQIPFNFDEQLNAGQTIDFVVNRIAGYSSLGTGLSATISRTVGPSWTGSAGDQNWVTAGNWAPAAVPSAGEVATVGAGGTAIISTAVNNSGGSIISTGSGSVITIASGGSVAGGTLAATNSGSVIIDGIATPTSLSAQLGTGRIDTGSLTTSVVNGSLSQTGGHFSPGTTPAIASISGNYTQTGGELDLLFAGSNPAQASEISSRR